MPGARLTIGKVPLDRLSFSAAVDRCLALARERKAAYVVTPNVDHIVRAESDASYVAIAQAADLSLADGQPVVWAARLLRERGVEKISGSDLMPALCAAAADRGLSIFLMGGMPGEAEKAAAVLKERHPTLVVSGLYCPPFGFERDEAESRRIVSAINASGAAIVFVGVGSPKQERWIAAWRSELRCGLLLGIGITIAFIAGTVRRAPPFMQRLGLEWLYRLAQEPKRLGPRYAKDLVFAWIVARELWTRRGRAAIPE